MTSCIPREAGLIDEVFSHIDWPPGDPAVVIIHEMYVPRVDKMGTFAEEWKVGGDKARR